MTPWLFSFCAHGPKAQPIADIWMFSWPVTELSSEEVFQAYLLTRPWGVKVGTFWFLFTKVTFIQNNAYVSPKLRWVIVYLKGLILGWSFLLRSHAVKEWSKASIAGHLFQRCHWKQQGLSSIFWKKQTKNPGSRGLLTKRLNTPQPCFFGLLLSSAGFNIFLHLLWIRNSENSKPKLTCWCTQVNFRVLRFIQCFPTGFIHQYISKLVLMCH